MERIIAQAGLWSLVVIGELIAMHIYGGLLRAHFAPSGFHMPGDLLCFWANGARFGNPEAVHGLSVGGICAYMYPPPFLLVAAPLSWLTPFWCYLVWIALTNLALAAAARVAGMGWDAVALGLASPPNLYCIAVGQNGALVSALLLLGLGLSERNPRAAGIFAGGLVIKPQFALLLPICFLASRNWRAVLAAAATALGVCVASGLIFGLGAWHEYFYSGTVTARKILTEPWAQPFQGVMVSWFIMLRSMGAGLRLAYAAQAAASLAAAAAAWWLWSRPLAPGPDRLARLAVTLCLAVLATPYAYVYDLPALGMALAGFAGAMQWKPLLPLGIFTVVTGFYIFLSMLGFAVGAMAMLVLAVMLWPKPGRAVNA